MNCKKFVVLIAAALSIYASSSFAQDVKTDLIREIAAVRGVHEVFEQQLAQQQQSLKGYGTKLIADMAAQSGFEPGPQDSAALDRFIERGVRMFSAEEFSARWLAAYGADLSTDELREILKYYKSPVGAKDIATNKAVEVALAVWLNEESQRRIPPLLFQLAEEFRQIRAAKSLDDQPATISSP